VRARATFLGLLVILVVAASPGLSRVQAQPGAERFVLTGLVFVEGGSGLAWLQEPSITANRVVAVRPGEAVGPYRLTRIFEDRVELTGPEGEIVIPLYNASAAPNAGIVSASPAPESPAGVGSAGVAPRLSAATPSAPAPARAFDFTQFRNLRDQLARRGEAQPKQAEAADTSRTAPDARPNAGAPNRAGSGLKDFQSLFGAR